jgi:hypothetical protein
MGVFLNPRILDLQLMRQKNLPLSAIYLNPQLLKDTTIDSDWFDVLVRRENDIKFYADGLGGEDVDIFSFGSITQSVDHIKFSLKVEH